MLTIEGLKSGYGNNEILTDVQLEFDEQQIATVIGPNGAGKSTLFKAIFGVIDVWDGSILLDGEDITHYSPREKLDLGIGFVPQGQNVFVNMTVRENLEMGGYKQDRNRLSDGIEGIFDMFPVLEEKQNDAARSLSGGQQQILSMSRVLMKDPEVLLLDEPSLGLAPKLVDEMFAHVQEVHDGGVGILMIEQNADRALRFSDWGYVLDSGQILHSAPAEEIRQSEEIKQLYLGK